MKDELFDKYNKYFKAIGFKEYMIDFSYIKQKHFIELAEKVKEICMRDKLVTLK